ncbi:indole-3-acetic acid-induced protein ARG7 [Ricinus communis]|uniref:Indole-3-acetic acid-induced protein ARG7, putative n=1 Tax=Ricinus communis TaxID=3988 RepID=B9RG63_RICCO|nr:indole-3-acetic acid-induced protein ARG7 [Ricinus communis]EEF49518.1 Indole-3-acetic acid-induced protein ARG7, putative [Ricinus communis]|eukprot:XP_002513015.1 indole-3-acetic acid-induced protein ARG7 [Ricinus communis]
MSKSNKIRHIVRVQQMLKRWRRKARLTASSRGAAAPADVPAGHVAVCVGESYKRFIVRATYLNHPIFKNLLVQAEEEYGFKNIGPLTIPCDESVFEEILRVVSSRSESLRFSNVEEVQRCCHVDIIRSHLEFLSESRPLLHG